MARNMDVTNKVIVLFILSRLDGLTLQRLNELAVGTAYLDYFQFMQAFESLREDGCIAMSVRKGESERDASGRPLERCSLTPQGAEILRTLSGNIPRHVAVYLAGETGRWIHEERNNRAAEAYWQQDVAGGYRVELKSDDGIGVLLELRMRLPAKADAVALCERFLDDPAAFHRRLLRHCLPPGDPLPPGPDPSSRPTKAD